MILATEFETQTCVYQRCGVIFAITAEFAEVRHQDHAWFYCPNGHKQRWSQENDTEKYKRIYRAERDRCRDLTSDLAEAEGSIRAYKGHTTRRATA